MTIKDTVNKKIGRDGYKIAGIVLHITADSKPGQALRWLQNPAAKASAHYIIEKSGETIQLVAPENTAWHAGVVNKPTAKIYFDKGNINPNLYTIGIEMVSSGEPLTVAQESALIDLIKTLSTKYNIPMERYNIIGHYELNSVDKPFDPVKSYSVDDIVKKGGAVMNWKVAVIQYLLDEKILNDPQWLSKPDEPATIAFVCALVGGIYKRLKK